jgi:pimeloyl-ACP methyl ester carboxylesterase
MRNCRLVTVPNAGHWLHHDQLQFFLQETSQFLEEEQ